ncbi:hypothetical protein [Cystobacter fuscus]|uniref:hypothetical protein n=1 Tax=Cystobacter fuscus TaxID=43 RepID=UPI001B7FE670|nr:hypothetical protein [Cystobacter fuscus]
MRQTHIKPCRGRWRGGWRHPASSVFEGIRHGGTAWSCALGPEQKLECGEKSARGQDQGDRSFVQLFNGRNDQGYQGFFYVGAVSASPPAVRQGVEPAGAARGASSGR